MPLPANSSISLQPGSSISASGATSKPKMAMIMRMTEETLDALQILSPENRMDFEFGDHPGIYIGDQFFPMRYNKEKENQELFIRTTTAVRPNAPLRLNANIIGKFVVERNLSEKLTSQIHNSAAALAKQREERRTILLDTPPVNTPAAGKNAAKRKAPTKSAARPTIAKSYVATPSQPPTAASTSSSSSLPAEVVASLRQRLVHYLAIGPATAPDIVKQVGSVEADRETRTKIIEILNEVAEQAPTGRKATASASQDTKWQLKQRSWLEVRPYEYTGFTDNVRTAVARQARTRLSDMKIPEQDPAWQHVLYRKDGASAGQPSTTPVQKATNGTSSAAVKEKAKAKAKEAKAKDFEVKAKSEAVQPSAKVPISSSAQALSATVARQRLVSSTSDNTVSRNGKGKDRDMEKEEGELSASQTPPRISNGLPSTSAAAARRLPGSRPHGTPTPTMPPPPPSQSASQSAPPSTSQSSVATPPKRTGPVDARGPKRSMPEPSERARAAPPIPPPPPTERKVSVQAKKERLSTVGTPTNQAVRERDKDIGKQDLDREAAQERKIRREREALRKERERESDRESLKGAKRDRESDRESLRAPERERELPREREQKERDRAAREKMRSREERFPEVVHTDKHGARREKARTSASKPLKAGIKRKQSEDSSDESSDWGIEDAKILKKSAVTSKSKRERDGSAGVVSKSSTSTLKSARGDAPPPKKLKRDISPLPPSRSNPVMTHKVSASTSSASSRQVSQPAKREAKTERDRDVITIDRGRSTSSRPANGTTKRRRSSITYTSSDSDDDEKPLKTKSSLKASTASANGTHATVKSHIPSINVSHVSHSGSGRSRPLPAHLPSSHSSSDHDDLRSRYSSTYVSYIGAYQKLCVQRNKIRNLLKRSGSVSAESDGDADVMSLDELERLTAEHQRLHNELQNIRTSYSQ